MVGNPIVVIVNWPVAILPYLEQEAIRNQWNFDGGYNSDPGNLLLNQNRVATYQCPSFLTSRKDPLYNTGAVIDYVPPSRVSAVMTNAAPAGYGLPAPPSGVFDGALANSQGIFNAANPPRIRYNKLASFSDGTSNTILLYEKGGRPDLYFGQSVFNPNSLGNGGWSAEQAVQPRGVDPDGRWPGYPATTTLFGPKMINANNQYGMFSLHSGGINACMADGSVRFLRDTLDAPTVMAMITRAGDDMIPPID